MTIPSTARRAGPYYGTAAQTVWPFAFKVFDPADIAVIFTTGTGVESTLVLNSDYSVTLNPNQDTSPGGAVVYPLTGSPMAPGNRLTVIGDLDYDQPLDLPDGGNFNPVAMENELDRIVMQIQQLRELLHRAVTISASAEPTTDTMLPAPGPAQLIGWNQTGSGLQNYDPSDLVVTGLYADWVYDTFTGNGATTTFGLQRAPGAVGNTDVSVNGQTYVPNTNFTVTGTNLVFNVAPTAGAQILVRYGSAAPQGPVASIYLKSEEKIATAGQTVFSLTNGYQPNIGTLSAYVNGVRMTPGYDYLETNSTTVTFSSGLKPGDRVLFITGTEVTTGTPGRGITSVIRTSGTGAPGTTDTYTITYSDATTSTFQVYNGANGTGSGDVVGPASAVNNNLVAFDTTTGKLVKDSGKATPAGAVVGTTDTQTLTTKTLTSPAINGGAATALTGLAVRNAGTGAFDMTIAYNGTLTAGRALTWNLNDAARTISLAGNITTAGAFTTSGAFALTLTTTATTNVTLPTTGTLATTTQVAAKQDTLVSGTNIKTVNGNSLLGSGDVTISGGGGGGLTLVVVSTTTQTAVSGSNYALTNAAATTVTAPASPTAGMRFGWMVCNGRTDNIINWGGAKHENISDTTMVINGPNEAGEAEYIDATFGWKVK